MAACYAVSLAAKSPAFADVVPDALAKLTEVQTHLRSSQKPEPQTPRHISCQLNSCVCACGSSKGTSLRMFQVRPSCRMRAHAHTRAHTHTHTHTHTLRERMHARTHARTQRTLHHKEP
eukprot:22842-Amphidinium_carterae.1